MLNYRSNNFDLINIKECILNIKDFSKKKINLLKIGESYKFPNYTLKYIAKGGNGYVYLLSSKKCGFIVVKNTLISIETENEIYFLEKVRDIIEKRICPNFLYNYIYENINNTYILFSEFANGTLETWLTDHHSIYEWNNCLFQILYGVYVMQNKMGTYHGDMKPKNILFKNIQNNTFKYNILDKTFYITTKYLFLIADFGKSQSIYKENNKISNESIMAFIKNNADLENIEALPKRILVSAVEKKYNGDLYNFHKFMLSVKDNGYNSYYYSEKNKINVELKKYPNNVKNKMLLRSLIYYAIEKKYIKPGDVADEYFDMKYPPLEIVNKLKQIGNHNIIDILDWFSNMDNGVLDLIEEFTYV